MLGTLQNRVHNLLNQMQYHSSVNGTPTSEFCPFPVRSSLFAFPQTEAMDHSSDYARILQHSPCVKLIFHTHVLRRVFCTKVRRILSTVYSSRCRRMLMDDRQSQVLHPSKKYKQSKLCLRLLLMIHPVEQWP